MEKNTEGLYGVLPVERLVMSRKVGKWCRLPYPGHKNGCPNFGHKDGCPPKAATIDKIMDTSREIYLVLACFDVGAHAMRMKEKHPEWSDRQCRNVLYWQGAVRAELKQSVRVAMRHLCLDAYTCCPEGAGVNVFVTARIAGLALEKTRHLDVDHHIALIGHSPSQGASR